ncbi:MAG: toll/interleukin-1 receptor domain-containing protein [Hyphomonadaceae bacterium]|nr:toll/interleukin-1 receptor domain-containing protein [Hyphomonadaceae bacterium]
MADVFISYARSDRARVEPIAAALKALGLDVWFDAQLTPGERFSDEIEREARAAKAVLVCWTPKAVGSDWVREEAAIGKERNVLTPVKLASCEPPFGFRQLQTEDLTRWTGDTADPAWANVRGRILALTAAKPQTAEPQAASLTALVRRLLVAQASESGLPLDYKELEGLVRARGAREGLDLTGFDQPALWAALNEVAEENRRRNEPLLTVLVINRATGRPGRGYFRKHAFLSHDFDPLAQEVFERHLERVRGYVWPAA